MTQNQYWKELYQLRVHTTFIELKLEQAEKRERIIKIFLAVTSSSCIGAWAIWNELSWVWAAIIALSQVLGAISQYLPYKGRVKAYSSLVNELEELMIRAEFRWHDIASGKLTESEINKSRFNIRAMKSKLLKKYIQTTISADDKLHCKAEKQAQIYLSEFY